MKSKEITLNHELVHVRSEIELSQAATATYIALSTGVTFTTIPGMRNKDGARNNPAFRTHSSLLESNSFEGMLTISGDSSVRGGDSYSS